MMYSDGHAIRADIKRHGLRQYEVSAFLGISEQSFSKWLRRPITEERSKRVEEAIQKAAKKKLAALLV